jgi:hypothetical protein
MEERKRTLYAVFILSSLLVSAYNHTPALTNSEIMLDLPCDEEFWSADSASSFYAQGGARMANHNAVTFHDSLGELLRTSEKQQQQHHQQQHTQLFGQSLNPQDLPKSDLRPSTFGCLVLINALHNYIWVRIFIYHSRMLKRSALYYTTYLNYANLFSGDETATPQQDLDERGNREDASPYRASTEGMASCLGKQSPPQ